jgi:protein-tyrosine-phosphatase
VRVLFLCTGNSARSQVAEAMLQRQGGAAVDVASAGSHPKPVHPNAVRVMRERGIDIRYRRSKHVRDFAGRRFDRVISLCDRVREVCPDFPGAPEVAHWSIADPAAEGTDDKQIYPAFVRMADELSTRIEFLLSTIHHEFASKEGPRRERRPG